MTTDKTIYDSTTESSLIEFFSLNQEMTFLLITDDAETKVLYNIRKNNLYLNYFNLRDLISDSFVFFFSTKDKTGSSSSIIYSFWI